MPPAAEPPTPPGVPERGAPGASDTSEPPAPGRALSIHAHPDDQEFTVGGTLAKWARAGCVIVTVCLTRGGAGSNEHTPPTMTREALIPIREAEQQAAARRLGIAEVVFLDYEDGLLEPSVSLRRDITRLIRRYRPDAVVCGDPTVRYYGSTYLNHPDHRAAADAALDAVFPSAPTRLIFPELLAEGLEPHHVRSVFIHGAAEPDTFVDIAAVLDLKVAALREHRSQLGDWDPTPMLTEWAREQGMPRGLGAAEAFRRMQLGGP
ncbi:MAG TPA: PIG-L deacetylase family protein [Methylomirabilota bacterium]|nr:PIG-L deacetylase family protein [Methylomirabilota bacterium]